MSRIIIKNLPADIKEERLRNLFGEKGTITDCSLKYTKDGVFRKFAFIGYRTPAEAEQAVKYFNKTFINTARIQVEKAKDLGDPTKPRAWSRYSEDSSLFKKTASSAESKTSIKQKLSKATANATESASRQEKSVDSADEISNDPEFQEFLALHKNRTLKPKWTDDAVAGSAKQDKVKDKKKKKSELISKSTDSDAEDVDSDAQSDFSEPDENVATKEKNKTISNQDLEYLKSKVKKIPELDDDDADVPPKQAAAPEPQSEESEAGLKYLVRMRGLPTNIKEKQLRDFFAPIELKTCKLPHRGKKSSSSSNVTVEFHSAADLELAMGRNKSFIGQKKVFLHKMILGNAVKSDTSEPAWKTKLAATAAEGSNEDETIAESGRLYVRNLPYCCTEEDVESLFKPYGLLSEVNMPIDKFTKKPKGFAFVTFVIPENAVKAYAALDRQSFQGRLLHILPGKVKDEEAVDLDNLPFKQKKELMQKKKATSSHNWNTLFLGSNAVADVVADKYGSSKSQLLDPTSSESIGVKLALGETQVVAETRQFLLDHDIALDAFSQAAAPRSKTVLIVKNLPAKTTTQELSDMFSKHGTVSRLVLPPSGVTAVVEFTEPTEAKAAFTALAYTKFKHLPLYLEWGPSGTFATPPPDRATNGDSTAAATPVTNKDNKEESKEDADDDDVELEGHTLFVKNVSFETTDESLSKFFAKCGKIVQASVARKKDPKKPGQLLSMGYGFVTFKSRDGAQKALKELQHASLDGHTLELKTSHRTTAAEEGVTRKKQDASKKQKTTKILVRNIPFEVKHREIRELFAAFGELRTVRLPKKVAGTGVHRGFGFIDFITHHDAKRAFNALCHSTHLYGRRLVLEWANTDESVDELRQKTAEHFHEDGPKRKKQKVDVTGKEEDNDM